MALKPTTFDDLRVAIGLSERVALTAAAILPNLNDESLIVLETESPTWESNDDEIAAFQRGHTPVVNGSDVYRADVTSTTNGDGDPNKADVTPIPHADRTYHLNTWDFRVIEAADPDECKFFDTPQSTLTDFGTGSPYFSPYYKIAGEYDRKSHLPV